MNTDEAAERVAEFCDEYTAGDSSFDFIEDAGYGTALTIADLRSLLADRERLTRERDEARDLAFRAAFAPEEGATEQWGVRCASDHCGFAEGHHGNVDEARARQLSRMGGESHPLEVVCRVVGPWKPATPASG